MSIVESAAPWPSLAVVTRRTGAEASAARDGRPAVYQLDEDGAADPKRARVDVPPAAEY